MDELPQFNTKMIMNITLPNNEKMIVVGKVVWAKEISSDNFIYGVQFYDLNREQLEKMKKLLPDNYSIPEL